MGLRTGLQSCTEHPNLSAALADLPQQMTAPCRQGWKWQEKKRIRSKDNHLVEGPVAPGTHVLLRGQGLIQPHCCEHLGLQPRGLRHRPCDFLLLIFRASLGHC